MSYTANNNNRSIPTVGTSSSRRPPTPRSTTSALERKLEETVKDLEEMRRSFGEQQVQLNHLSVEHEELKAKLNNKSTKETNFSFPGSKMELEQVRVSINASYLTICLLTIIPEHGL